MNADIVLAIAAVATVIGGLAVWFVRSMTRPLATTMEQVRTEIVGLREDMRHVTDLRIQMAAVTVRLNALESKERE
jgi:hypothetical protein